MVTKEEIEFDDKALKELLAYCKKYDININQFIFGALEVLKFEVHNVDLLWLKQKKLLPKNIIR